MKGIAEIYIGGYPLYPNTDISVGDTVNYEVVIICKKCIRTAHECKCRISKPIKVAKIK